MRFYDFSKKYLLDVPRGFSFFSGQGVNDSFLYTFPDVVRRKSKVTGSIVCSNSELFDRKKVFQKKTRRVFNSPNYRVRNRLLHASYFWHSYIGINYSRLSFITLTTLQHKNKYSDKILTSFLNKFLTYLRKYYNLKTYIWVVERQYNSGNLANCTEDLHFHILADIDKIDIGKCLSIWSGYLGFEAHPAMLDVKKVNLNDYVHLANYLFKYMSKNDYSDLVCPVYTSRLCGWSRDIRISDKSIFFDFIDAVPSDYVPVVANSFVCVYVPPKC